MTTAPAERIAAATSWWLCPNLPPCPHSGVVHDIEDLDDTRPRCCVEGCDCGAATPRKDPRA